jgi:pyruvate,water dikinase
MLRVARSRCGISRTKRESVGIGFLDKLRTDARNRYGGKAINLARLHRLGIRIPAGFAISAEAFTQFLRILRPREKLEAVLKPANRDLDELLANAVELCSIGAESSIPPPVAQAILSACAELERQIGHPPAGYAVRSSATVEDSERLSFAGQGDTFLCVHGADSILEAVKKTWLSTYSPRAVAYLHSKDVPLHSVRMAVVIQEMVSADVSGVMFTANVVNRKNDELLIDATWGLGEAIVSGRVTPDSFVINKMPLEIMHRQLGSKHLYSTPFPRNRPTCTVFQDTPSEKRGVFALTDEQLLMVATAGRSIEDGLGQPQDIEWSIKDGDLVILQTRPITTLRS